MNMKEHLSVAYAMLRVDIVCLEDYLEAHYRSYADDLACRRKPVVSYDEWLDTPVIPNTNGINILEAVV